MPKNYDADPAYEKFGSSEGILAAIEAMTSASILESSSAAYRIWTDPTAQEENDIVAHAWELTPSYTNLIYWGGQRYTRPPYSEGDEPEIPTDEQGIFAPDTVEA